MQNTYKDNLIKSFNEKEDSLISSLKISKIIVLFRLNEKDFETPKYQLKCFDLIDQLHEAGVIHIEVSWSTNPAWLSIMQEIKRRFKEISLGVASINSKDALANIKDLNVDYCMSPFFDRQLQIYAKKLNQLLIPGVLTPTEIVNAKSFGCKIIKLFPVSSFKSNYLDLIKQSTGKLPLIIAAGGIKGKYLDQISKDGYNGIVIGRQAIKGTKIDPYLLKWLKDNC